MARDKSFDSLKFLLICLVVFGHAIEKQVGINHLKLTCFSFIYTFHMPLFIFISGYFSKNMTWEKFKKSFKTLFPTYVVFQTFLTIPSMIFSENFEWKYALFPQSVLWYIAGLLIWRFFFCIIEKFKLSFLPVFTTFMVISILLGFITEVIPFIRIITFFPYFILGYYCTTDIYQKIRNLNKYVSAALITVFFVLLYFYVTTDYTLTLFGEHPFSQYSSQGVGIMYRLSSYVLAILVSVWVINLAPETFYKLGSRTLDVYLVHPFFIYFGYNLALSKLQIVPWLIVDVLVAVLIICICLFITKPKFAQYIINPSLFLFRNEKK